MGGEIRMQGRKQLQRLLCVAAIVSAAGGAVAQVHTVPYFPAAANPLLQGFVRVVNNDARGGTVSITAIDDAGKLFDTAAIQIGAHQTVHFNSDDLENGNETKRLSGSVGAGVGDWHLEIRSPLDLKVLAYLRTTDGFLTSMHDVVPLDGDRHWVPIFNPGSNVYQQSSIRLTNTGGETATVRIVGVDDMGFESKVETIVLAGESTSLTAQQLEEMGLGDGAGKWQLMVQSDRAIRVLNLLRSETGHVTNLSTSRSDQRPFTVVLVEARLSADAPQVDMDRLAVVTRDVLGQMGFVEEAEYRIIAHNRVLDISDAAADVLSEESSGPATRRFKKTIQEATSYATPKGHGLVFVGGISAWPTGRDHGSYSLGGPDVNFVSFCNGTVGFLTCSIREDCLGHELGHAFGMEHERHNWSGFDPQPDQTDAMARMTQCAPDPDRGYPDGMWSDEKLMLIGD